MTTDLVIDRDDRSAVESGGPAELSEPARGVKVEMATVGRTKSEDCATMERVVERTNVWLPYQRVARNKGAAGVAEVTVAEFKDWLVLHWPSVKQALLEVRYLPRPVRGIDIPKAKGGVRTLGGLALAGQRGEERGGTAMGPNVSRLPRDRAAPAGGCSPADPAYPLKHRMRNRTYGDVGGRRTQAHRPTGW